ncbi:hypothetical protein MTR_8g095640 [Medicago truncatula]|uniref:Uncharacterized protein n=1 Tax=Medicago truncatula TaxID=3880 RepID=G7LGJ4_MEDTR|nr:hypothetical protein MTR_8g095640 [Medicago truncatula]
MEEKGIIGRENMIIEIVMEENVEVEDLMIDFSLPCYRSNKLLPIHNKQTIKYV